MPLSDDIAKGGRTIDMTPTPAAMRHITAALQEQIERSRRTIHNAAFAFDAFETGNVVVDELDEGGERLTMNAKVHDLGRVISEALTALIEREEARIARIESGLADLS